jgi:hypothetical protein
MNEYDELVDAFDDETDSESDVVLPSDKRAFLASSDWTVETILGQVRQGNIDLAPTFQRRSVWDDRRASRFIESVFLGLPIPQLILAEDKNRPGAFIVLDGKQRLITLERFAAENGAQSEPVLRLSKLEQLPELSGLTFNDVRANASLAGQLRRFLNQTIRTVIIAGWPDEDYLNLIFLRLNSGSVPLSGQELRQALKPGRFTSRVNEFAAQSDGLHAALGIGGPDFRMRDTELAVRYVSFGLFLERYSGNLKSFFDSITELLNSEWDFRSEEVEHSFASLELAIETAREVHGAHAFHRFNGVSFENRFNRAVFDLQTLCYSVPEIAAFAIQNQQPLQQAFADLCTQDRRFADSLQATTKSIDATFIRLDTWVAAVEQVAGASLPRPTMIDEFGSIRVHWSALRDAIG